MKIHVITVDELLRNRSDHPLILDIRSQNAYYRGHIPGAISLPMEHEKSYQSSFKGNVPRWIPKNRRIVLYCERGVFSLEVCRQWLQLGYNVSSLQGGYLGYLRIVKNRSK